MSVLINGICSTYKGRLVNKVAPLPTLLFQKTILNLIEELRIYATIEHFQVETKQFDGWIRE